MSLHFAGVLATASQLLPARSQMAFTLGFHIVLASLGVAFPAITLIANYRGLRRDDPAALGLARRWSKVMAVLFAVGAVTGTVLSFEMGLLWPGLMRRFGDVFGVAFAIEGIFFFVEAIFIAIYIYGWDRLSPWAHFWTGVPIVVSGIGGALSVVAANSWMNQPSGFTLGANGKVTSVHPLEVIFNKATPYEVPHMILAAYMMTAFLVASVYAVGMLRGRRDRLHRLGVLIPLAVAAIATPAQIFIGDTAARAVARDQPTKFAAIEYVQRTGTGVPAYLGGALVDGKVRGAIKIPDADSLLVGFSAGTKVIGLDATAPADRPPAPTMLHLAFDTMVGIAFALLAVILWLGIAWVRRRDMPATRWFLRAVAGAGVAAIVALECGWIVTEVGRQPWVVYRQLRTADAVTGASGLWTSFAIVLVLYTLLGITTVLVLRAMARRWRSAERDDVAVPYGPPPGAGRAGP
ncbi:MAG TPA: cytochrome ubiquinol oxidase subunit I [Solirubrobacteraceae bacterium]|nr:cytochrome ubiquinol oxidase subunit I [Solirubrobacteraceae bacterium]